MHFWGMGVNFGSPGRIYIAKGPNSVGEFSTCSPPFTMTMESPVYCKRLRAYVVCMSIYMTFFIVFPLMNPRFPKQKQKNLLLMVIQYQK